MVKIYQLVIIRTRVILYWCKLSDPDKSIWVSISDKSVRNTIRVSVLQIISQTRASGLWIRCWMENSGVLLIRTECPNYIKGYVIEFVNFAFSTKF